MSFGYFLEAEYESGFILREFEGVGEMSPYDKGKNLLHAILNDRPTEAGHGDMVRFSLVPESGDGKRYDIDWKPLLKTDSARPVYYRKMSRTLNMDTGEDYGPKCHIHGFGYQFNDPVTGENIQEVREITGEGLMAVIIPNYEDTPAFDAMAARDKTDDYAARCDSLGTGVVSGMAVTQDTGSDMKVAVASGTVQVAGVRYTYTGTGSPFTIGAANTADRRDVVIYRVGTGVTVLAGTPCSLTTAIWTAINASAGSPPVKPSIAESTDVVLAEVYVAGSGGTATTVITTSTNIVDKRNVIGVLASAANLGDVAQRGTSRYNLRISSLTAVQAVATTNIDITSAPANPSILLDNYTFTTSGTDSLLLTGQTTASQNGIWTWNGVGSALTRQTDFPAAGTITTGRTVQVNNGTFYKGSVWALAIPSTPNTIIDTTAQTWTCINTNTSNPSTAAAYRAAVWQDATERPASAATGSMVYGTLSVYSNAATPTRNAVVDVVMGDSTAGTAGAALGVTDWGTLVCQNENRQAGYPDPGVGLVMPFGASGHFSFQNSLTQPSTNVTVASCTATAGNNTISVSSGGFPGAVIGQAVSISATTGGSSLSATSGGAATATFTSTSTGIVVGQFIQGTGITGLATVASVTVTTSTVITVVAGFGGTVGSLTNSSYTFIAALPSGTYITSLTSTTMGISSTIVIGEQSAGHAIVVLDENMTAGPGQVGLGLATNSVRLTSAQSIGDGCSAAGAATTSSVTLTSGSTAATGTTTNIVPGMSVIGPGIPPGTKVVSSVGSAFIFSQPAFLAGAQTLTFGRTFRRFQVFYQKVYAGDKFTITTVGLNPSSTSTTASISTDTGATSTAPFGYSWYDSGDLGNANMVGLGGITIQGTSGGGGAGILIIGIRYFETTGTYGTIVDNISVSGSFLTSWSTAQPAVGAGYYRTPLWLQTLVNMDTPPRRVFMIAGINDASFGIPLSGSITGAANYQNNLITFVQYVQAISPTTEVVLIASWYGDGGGNINNNGSASTMTFTAGSNIVTGTFTGGGTVGLPVVGPYIPTGTTITAQSPGSPGSITLSNNCTLATSTTTGLMHSIGTRASGNTNWATYWVPAVQNAAAATGATLLNLYERFGDFSVHSIIESVTVTAGSMTATVPSTPAPGPGFCNVAVGQLVLGAGIANGTVVTAVSGNSISLSAPVLATGTVTLTFRGDASTISLDGLHPGDWSQNSFGHDGHRAIADTITQKLAISQTQRPSNPGSGNFLLNAPGGTPTINTDYTSIATFTGMAAAITSLSTSGSPIDGQKLLMRFTDNGTSRAITYNSSNFVGSGLVPLTSGPANSTVTANGMLTVGAIYDTVAGKWRLVAVA